MTKRSKVGLIYFVVIIATFLLRVATYEGVYDALNMDSDVFFTLISQIFCFGILPIGMYLLLSIKDRQTIMEFPSDMGIKKVSGRNWLRTLAIGICMIITSIGVSMLWSIILTVIGYTRIPSSTDYYSIGILFKELALSALLPGIFEETTHRGFLYVGYKNQKWKFVFISGLLFALMHQNIAQTCYTFYDGCIMALLMYYTGSIFPGIFVHFLNNAVSIVSEYIEQNGGPFSFITKAQDWILSTMGGLAVGVLMVLIAFTVLIIMFMRMRKEAEQKEIVSHELLSKVDERPMYKDAYFISTVVVGIVATIFTLVWGIWR